MSVPRCCAQTRAATEGYRSNTTRNEQQVWPSLKQRAGDFSTTTLNGAPVQIFNPYCRGGVAKGLCDQTQKMCTSDAQCRTLTCKVDGMACLTNVD